MQPPPGIRQPPPPMPPGGGGQMSMMQPPPIPSVMAPKPTINLAPPIVPPVSGFSMPPPPAQPPQIPIDDLQPASKRLKTGEDNLIAEKDFLSMHEANGPVTFFISLPVVPDKPEWNLNGQTITLSLPLTETVCFFFLKLYLKFLKFNYN